MTTKEWNYMALYVGLSVVKPGVTDDPDARLEQLQRMSPVPVKFLRVCKSYKLWYYVDWKGHYTGAEHRMKQKLSGHGRKWRDPRNEAVGAEMYRVEPRFAAKIFDDCIRPKYR